MRRLAAFRLYHKPRSQLGVASFGYKGRPEWFGNVQIHPRFVSREDHMVRTRRMVWTYGGDGYRHFLQPSHPNPQVHVRFLL